MMAPLGKKVMDFYKESRLISWSAISISCEKKVENQRESVAYVGTLCQTTCQKHAIRYFDIRFDMLFDILPLPKHTLVQLKIQFSSASFLSFSFIYLNAASYDKKESMKYITREPALREMIERKRRKMNWSFNFKGGCLCNGKMSNYMSKRHV